MAKKNEKRVLVTLTCQECKKVNYRVSKNTRNTEEKLHYCDLHLFEEGDFYTIIDGDKYYYEFKCKCDLLDCENVKLYIDDQEQTINLRKDGDYVFLSTSLKPFSSIGVNENTKLQYCP